SNKCDLPKVFDFIPAKISDMGDIVDMCINEFIYEEPHSRGSNNLVGFRLLSVGHRDHALDVEPVPFTEPKEIGVRTLCEILDKSKAKLWSWADDSVQKVIRREITYVTPHHQRKGIAEYLLHLGLNFQDLKGQGFHGITSEASSLANQKLLAKHGYICIGKSEYNLQMHDGNDGVKVYFKDLR
ncbi:hypothetical protein Angca_000330, partial [Angiostrongylus cantonensis]